MPIDPLDSASLQAKVAYLRRAVMLALTQVPHPHKDLRAAWESAIELADSSDMDDVKRLAESSFTMGVQETLKVLKDRGLELSPDLWPEFDMQKVKAKFKE